MSYRGHTVLYRIRLCMCLMLQQSRINPRFTFDTHKEKKWGGREVGKKMKKGSKYTHAGIRQRIRV